MKSFARRNIAAIIAATTVVTFILISFFAFEFYVRKTAQEIIQSWQMNEQASLQQGNFLSSVMKNQSAIMSSDFIKGLTLIDARSNPTKVLVELGQAERDMATESFLGTELSFSRKGALRFYASMIIDQTNHIGVVFLVAPVFARWLYIIYLGSLLLLGLAFSILVVRIRTRESREREAKLANEAKYVAQSRQVAHDIRGPLSALHAVAAHIENDAQKELLQMVSKRLNGIAEMLLDNTRESSSAGDPLTNVVMVAKSVIEEKILSSPRLREKIRLEISEAQKLVELHEIELGRILSNLIDNAVQAIDPNSGSVSVSIITQENRVCLSIADDGQGIPEDALSRLNSGESFTSKPQGNGLGLSHAREQIHKHGGTFLIESIVGQGTTIRINFPVPAKT